MGEITVTGMYIPEQAGERDKVGQTSEETNIALLDVCEKNIVKVVGWVHSHPTFDAYLSSVDQNQQGHSQSALKHAVAVVFDKDEDPSFFTLLPDGLKMLRSCEKGRFPSPRHAARADLRQGKCELVVERNERHH